MNFLKEIFQYNSTVISLAKNDFKNRYAGSYLGALWAFIQPLITILIFWFVFEVGFRATPVENVPYLIWFICGIIPWFFFSDAVLGATMSIVDYNYLVKKVMFNINILPLVRLMVALFVHLFFIVLLFVVCFSTSLPVTIYSVQILYYSFSIFVFSLGVSYLTSSLVPFSKDFGQIVAIVLQFGFWLTPVVWNYEILSPKLLTIFKLNPAFYIVQGYRDSLVYKVWFWERPLSTLFFWITTGVVFYVGKVLFRRLKPHFADVL